MIPILWRYLLRSYLRVFLLSVCTFIGILIVSRFKEIARFAALCGNWPKVGLFTLYQIPFILPLAIPISAFLSAFLLFQRLSSTQELSALRASGIGIRPLIAPLLCMGCILSIFHFSICADIAPYCGRQSKALLYEETSENPLLLLQRQSLVKLKHAYLKMRVKKEGKIAKDVWLIAYNPSNDRLTLFTAEKLRVSKDRLLGSKTAIVLHLFSNTTKTFDPLILENQESMSTSATLLSTTLKKHRPRLEPGGLSMKMLCLRAMQEGKYQASARIEILRRSMLSLAVATLTLLGSAFGMQGGRIVSKKQLLISFLLVLVVVVSYLGIKELKKHLISACIIACMPHGLIFFLSFRRLKLFSQGAKQ